jgi:hypothetical protein
VFEDGSGAILRDRHEKDQAMSELPVFEAADGIKETCKFCTALGIVPKLILS